MLGGMNCFGSTLNADRNNQNELCGVLGGRFQTD
jgi:hypothetical protein